MHKAKHFTKIFDKTAIAFSCYLDSNKWYMPIGLAFWNRYNENTNNYCYYKHLIEISVGFLCLRFQFCWYERQSFCSSGDSF